jgi:hypothetical protein
MQSYTGLFELGMSCFGHCCSLDTQNGLTVLLGSLPQMFMTFFLLYLFDKGFFINSGLPDVEYYESNFIHIVAIVVKGFGAFYLMTFSFVICFLCCFFGIMMTSRRQ